MGGELRSSKKRGLGASHIKKRRRSGAEEKEGRKGNQGNQLCEDRMIYEGRQINRIEGLDGKGGG